MRALSTAILTAMLSFWASPAAAALVTIDFEAFADLEELSAQVAGVTFSNAAVLTAGSVGGSLNDFDFPPNSGVNVAFDAAGPIRLDFAAPVLSVGGFFTYAAGVTLEAFDALDGSLGSSSSAFFNNLFLSGDLGSSPNELIEVSAANIAYVLISGDAFGGSFTLDDLRFNTSDAPAPVAEPGTLMLLGLGAAVFTRRRLRDTHQRKC